ncbi:hypothetical protein ACWOE3_03190 [Enterococcus dispar]|uniref:Uncharacterized protein n=1 Tax=Enterococcus dispar ATCC 51266 TaxID=1139219 RepID=S0KIJ3_9ENTE|nr:hypothetical protein [Enterococcus dispar]EOT40760.1 hypothetical protein OMK_01675 [Enterococcus dispar ATCC 51266]EOW86867.1 hypothetical protein I569_02231 [Enterococcus dispar ATCC 51266]OJG39811.1 hypothetical protein RV01_GL000993 [Enterococcus dispar]
MYKKILQWLFIIGVTIFLILKIDLVIDFIITANLNLTQDNFWGLCALYFIEIMFVLIIYDSLMVVIYPRISSGIVAFCRFGIRTERIKLTQFLIRLDYNMSRIYSFLRLGWVRYASSDLSPVWIGISKLTLFQKIVGFVRIVISFPMLISIILTLFSLNRINIDWMYSQFEHFWDFLKRAVSIEINLGDIFSKLPAIVALFTIIPVFFFFYFYSQKREVRKIIDKQNKDSFEIIVVKHNELSKLISKSIYSISENLDYVINCQSLVINLVLSKKVKNFYNLEERHYRQIDSVDKYLFKEIPEFEKIAELLSELTSEDLVFFTRRFYKERYDMRQLYYDFYRFKTPDALNNLFLTKYGIENKISNTTEVRHDCSKEDLNRYRSEEENTLSSNIYDALEMIYALKRYNDSLKRYLHSSSVEKTLMKILIKEN